MTLKIIACVFLIFLLRFPATVPSTPHKKHMLPWAPTIINHVLETYVPSGRTPESLCTVHGQIYEEHRQNLTLWAVQMVDASSRGPSGLLMGNNYNFGDFDECAQAKEPRYNISGKYVVVKFGFWLDKNNANGSGQPDVSRSVYAYPDPDSSVWEVFMKTSDRRIVDRNAIYWALCVPDSCKDDEIKNSLIAALAVDAAQHRMNINVTVDRRFTFSERRTNNSSDIALYIFILITLIMVSLVLVSTYYHLKIDDDHRGIPLWMKEMSIVQNWKRLTNSRPQEFSSASGLKALSMFLIIFGHRMMISTFAPLFNQYENEMLVGDLMYTLVKNGSLIVNTFLVITGFLTFHKITIDVNSNKRINVFQYVYRRWIRLSPLYAYVMAFVGLVFPKLSHGGPIGRGVIFDSSCVSSTAWWTQLLYINNYVEPSIQCLIPSWYLAVDMQLYAVCAVCGYVLWLHRPSGITLLYITTAISIIIPGIVVYQKSYNGVFLFYFDDFKTLLSSDEFIETYLYTHNRASPYIIGMLGGYVYYRIDKSTTKNWSQSLAWSLFIAASLVHIVTWLGAWLFYSPDRPYRLSEHVAYAILHRVGWAVPICIYIICESQARFGLLVYTIGNKIFQPISTLSYAALLIHSPIQLMLAGMQRSPPYYNTVISSWMSSGDIVFSYFAALLLYLFIEAPLTQLKDIDLAMLSSKRWSPKTIFQ